MSHCLWARWETHEWLIAHLARGANALTAPGRVAGRGLAGAKLRTNTKRDADRAEKDGDEKGDEKADKRMKGGRPLSPSFGEEDEEDEDKEEDEEDEPFVRRPSAIIIDPARGDPLEQVRPAPAPSPRPARAPPRPRPGFRRRNRHRLLVTRRAPSS